MSPTTHTVLSILFHILYGIALLVFLLSWAIMVLAQRRHRKKSNSRDENC